MMRLSTKRILSVLFAVLFIIGAVLVYSILIRSEGSTISEKRAEVASKTNLLANQQNAVSQVQSLIKQFKDIAAVQQTISLAIPTDAQTVDALHQIEAISQASNVTLTSIKFALTPPPRSSAKTQTFVKRLGILSIDLSANGAYANLKKFLQLMETTVRVANVKTFDFQPGNGKDVPESMAASVEMYYQE